MTNNKETPRSSSRRVGLVVGVLLLLGLGAFAGWRWAVLGRTQVVLGTPFALRVGETRGLKGTPLSITFEKVLDDSLCPPRVKCFWQGSVEILLAVRAGDVSTPITLNSAPQAGGMTEASVPGSPYRIEFLEVGSEPLAEDATRKAYIAHLLMTRL